MGKNQEVVGSQGQEVKSKRFTGVRLRYSTISNDITYYIIFKDNNNKTKREKIGKYSEGYREKTAHKIRNERIQQVRHGETVKPKSYTIDQLFDNYYYPHIKQSKKDYAKDKARYDYRIRPNIGNIVVDRLTVSKLLDFKTYLNNELKIATVNHHLKVIRQLLNYTGGLGLHNNTKLFKRGKLDQGISLDNPRNEKTRYLTKLEAKQLLDALCMHDIQLYRLAIIGLYTGMRAGEVLQLQYKHIDMTNNQITLSTQETKHNIARSIPMHNKIILVIQQIIEENELSNSNLLFVDKHGKQMEQIPKAYYEIVRDIGLNDDTVDNEKVDYHTLRHTFASWLAMSGCPIVTLQYLLGHTTLQTTMRYAHLIPDKSGQYINSLNFS